MYLQLQNILFSIQIIPKMNFSLKGFPTIHDLTFFLIVKFRACTSPKGFKNQLSLTSFHTKEF